MQLASGTHIPDGLLAASVLLSEKPHQGVPSWKSAPHQGIDEANCTAAIGLRAAQHLNRVRSRYTGKERDSETGLDSFGARFYSSGIGRFTSADWSGTPEAVPYANLANPQSLNLYTYVGNNPLRQVDADGHLGLNNGAPGECNGQPNCQTDQEKMGAKQAQQQNVGSQKVGGETVSGLTNVLTNESRDLTGGKPGNIEAGKIAEANAIINNNLLKHPGEEASDVLSKGAAASAGRSDDERIMRQAYLDRLAGKPDPVQGRTYFGNSHNDIKSRPIGNGRQTVYMQFGPFDHGKGPTQYIYIYNDPVLNK